MSDDFQQHKIAVEITIALLSDESPDKIPLREQGIIDVLKKSQSYIAGFERMYWEKVNEMADFVNTVNQTTAELEDRIYQSTGFRVEELPIEIEQEKKL